VGPHATNPSWRHPVPPNRDLALQGRGHRAGRVTNPRKDLRKWATSAAVYGDFFTKIFEPVPTPRTSVLQPERTRTWCREVAPAFAEAYQPPMGTETHLVDQIRQC